MGRTSGADQPRPGCARPLPRDLDNFRAGGRARRDHVGDVARPCRGSELRRHQPGAAAAAGSEQVLALEPAAAGDRRSLRSSWPAPPSARRLASSPGQPATTWGASSTCSTGCRGDRARRGARVRDAVAGATRAAAARSFAVLARRAAQRPTRRRCARRSMVVGPARAVGAGGAGAVRGVRAASRSGRRARDRPRGLATAPPVLDAVQALVDRACCGPGCRTRTARLRPGQNRYFGMYVSIHGYAGELRAQGERRSASPSSLTARYAAFGTDAAIDALYASDRGAPRRRVLALGSATSSPRAGGRSPAATAPPRLSTCRAAWGRSTCGAVRRRDRAGGSGDRDGRARSGAARAALSVRA